jgi:hypothetical protein
VWCLHGEGYQTDTICKLLGLTEDCVENRRALSYAERKNRAARFRNVGSAAGAAGVTVFLRASGYNCSASTSADTIRCCGSFARHEAKIASNAAGIDEFTCDGGSGRDDST